MWIKQNHEGLLGSFGLSLAMGVGVGSGALLCGLCGHAVLMLANSSNDTRVANGSSVAAYQSAVILWSMPQLPERMNCVVFRLACSDYLKMATVVLAKISSSDQ